MSDVSVCIELNASPESVWAFLEPIEHHVDWMADAVAIKFETEQTRGVGTRFVCDTKVGPIKLRDLMEITKWTPATNGSTGAMGVAHHGIVSGTGQFTIASLDDGARTSFTWTEDLDFPWYLGGRLGEIVGGKIVLRMIWQRNLKALKQLIEDS